MALAIATMTIATNSVSANAATSFGLYYTSGAPSSNTNVSDTYYTVANGGSYNLVNCTSYSQYIALSTVTATSVSPKYPTQSVNFASTGTQYLYYTGTVPLMNQSVSIQLSLNNYVAATSVSVYGTVGVK